MLTLKLIALSLAIVAATPVLTTDECLQQCQTNYPLIGGSQPRPAPCCNCCQSGSGETCHEIPEYATCCEAEESFCGCLSYRAFCSGGFYNSSRPSNTFGTCYNPADPTAGVCCYEPSPNLWRVCPFGSSCCVSSSMIGCCDPDEECTSSYADPMPVCRKKVLASPSPRGGEIGIVPGCEPCGHHQSCCKDPVYGASCFDPRSHSCETSGTSATVCAIGDKACGRRCYNPSQYQCCNGDLSPLSQTCS